MIRLRKVKGGGVGVYKKKIDEIILINVLEYKNIEGIIIEIY